MPDIFSYTSYARFIKDYQAEKKRENRAFSYEAFARKAGFKTRSYLIEVAAGKKELSRASLYNVAKAMELGARETEYLEALVAFQHASTFKEREFHFRKLGALAGRATGRMLAESQFGYFAEWWHPVVRELAAMESFRGDYARLGKSLRPAITARQARESVELLLRLGLLVRTVSGRFQQADGTLRTPDELTSFAVVRYQKENLRLADEALDAVEPGDRDISTFTAGVSRACFLEIKKEIQAFRNHLADLVERDKGADRVCQLNLQFFPVSDTQEGEA
jgi:uncharacterized protein (TIGR02147 family)